MEQITPHLKQRPTLYRISPDLIRIFLILFPLFTQLNIQGQSTRPPRKFYIANEGSDNNPGSYTQPWASLQAIRKLNFRPGDIISFKGNEVFKGQLLLKGIIAGSEISPLTITSYGKGIAKIDGGNGNAVHILESKFIVIKNIQLEGSGRKNGNTSSGLLISSSQNIQAGSMDISGFQKSGIEISNSSDIHLNNIYAHSNGFAGISVNGTSNLPYSNQRIYIGYCRAESNPGDPTVLDNHSGNGIVVSAAKNVLIEFCEATDNGWDMPRVGNGPVGIWAWQADSVTIQHCISYRNHTQKGAMDGGGFGLDGGVSHSIVQFNLSYQNDGYGYGIFEFGGAIPWHDNVFRYNVSFNDGNLTPNGASVVWWNGTGDSSLFRDGYIYNNLFYNSNGYSLGVIPDQHRTVNFFFLNNIFVAKDELMIGGDPGPVQFYGNDWWSLKSKFKMNGNTDFEHWVMKGREKLNGQIVGNNTKPELLNTSTPTLDDPRLLPSLYYFKLDPKSQLRNKGLNLKKIFHIEVGGKDFYGQSVPLGEACEPGIFELD